MYDYNRTRLEALADRIDEKIPKEQIRRLPVLIRLQLHEWFWRDSSGVQLLTVDFLLDDDRILELGEALTALTVQFGGRIEPDDEPDERPNRRQKALDSIDACLAKLPDQFVCGVASGLQERVVDEAEHDGDEPAAQLNLQTAIDQIGVDLAAAADEGYAVRLATLIRGRIEELADGESLVRGDGPDAAEADKGVLVEIPQG